MSLHRHAALGLATALMLLVAALAAIESAAGTPRQAVPYPDEPAPAWTVAPTMWGMP